MKSFKEFSLIIEGRSRAEAQKDLQSKSNPGDWELVNAGSSESPSWRVRLKSNREVAGSRPTPTYAGKSKESKEKKARDIAKKTQGKQESEKKKEEPKQVVKNVDPKTRKGVNCLGSGCKGSEHLGPPKPAPKKPVAKPAPKKPTPKKDVSCLGSGCPGSEHLPAPKRASSDPQKTSTSSSWARSDMTFKKTAGSVDQGGGGTTIKNAVPKSNSGRPFARGAKTVYHTNKRKIW